MKLNLRNRIFFTASSLLGLWLFAWVTPTQAQAPTFDFAEQWHAGPHHRAKNTLGESEAQVFVRSVLLDGQSISIGSVIALRIPKNPQANYSPQRVAEVMLKNLGFDHWTAQRRQKQAYVFEANWQALHRYVRFYLREEAASFAVSVAMFRPSYSETVAVESELIQRHLAGVLDTPIPSLDVMTAWIDQILPSAHAEPCPGCSFSNPAACGACVQDAAKNPNAGLDGTLNGAVNNADGKVTKQVDKALGLVPGTQAQIDRGLAEIKRSNDLAEKLIQPESVFVIGFAAAAGAATGALVINLVAQGFTAGTDYLIEAVTHAKEEARLNENFVAAKDKIEKLYEDVAKLEADIDLLDGINDLIRQEGSKERLLLLKGAHREQLTQDVDSKQKRILSLRDQGVEANCLTEENAQLFDLKQSLKTTTELVENIGNTTQEKICRRLKDDFSKLKQAEKLLEDMRGAISAGEAAWSDNWKKKYDETSKAFNQGETPEQLEKNRQRDIEAARGAKKNDLARIQTDLNRAFDQCWRADCSSAGRFLSAILFVGPLACPNSKAGCKKQILDVQSRTWGAFARDIRERSGMAKDTEAQALRDANEHFDREKSLKGVAAHSKVNYDAYQAIKSWILEQKRAQSNAVHKGMIRDAVQGRAMQACRKYW